MVDADAIGGKSGALADTSEVVSTSGIVSTSGMAATLASRALSSLCERIANAMMSPVNPPASAP